MGLALTEESAPGGGTTAVETEVAAAPYLAALTDYARRDVVRFHVPAHKGGAGAVPLLTGALGAALELDVPACIDGIDIGVGEPPLAAAERLAAEAWGARRTWFLVNGASEGSHALCLALGNRAVVAQRNVHQSTLHAMVLAGSRPAWVTPAVDPRLGIGHCVTPAELDATLVRTPDAAAAFVVSPTYYGAAADVAGLAAVCHSRGVPLVVDEAWGAHFHFHAALPQDALAAGADAVISGTHKLAGSLTQSAMLHVGHRSRIADEDIARGLALVRSTSPSSLLLASLDAARAEVATNGRAALDGALGLATALKSAIDAIDGYAVLGDELVGSHGVAAFDPLRVTIDVTGTGRDGFAIAEALRRNAGIELELIAGNVVIAHLGMHEQDGAAGRRLVAALRDLPALPVRGTVAVPPVYGEPCMAPREAFFAPHERLPLADAVGRVCADTIAVYPPGIANVLPGERLTQPLVEYLLAMHTAGWPLRGTWDAATAGVRVVTERIHQ